MNVNKKIILITGGAGFIGSHLCEKYLNEGHRVICVDNLQTTFTPKNIERFFDNENFTFIKHDIINPFRIPEKIDWIFNLACAGSYTSYQYDPVHTIKSNTIGMINMLELARKDGARLLQSSTSEIYGDPLEIPQKETYRGNVNILGPRACYDEGKRCAETLCMDYHREYGVDVKIIRIFNTYGPNMDPNDGRAVTNFVLNALDGKDLVIYGDGSNTRSFQYIDDLIAGIDAMMRARDFIGPVNLGNPGEITMKDLAELVIKKTQSQSKIIFTEGASDDPRRRCPEISLAEKELGWKPEVSLAEGLEKTIEYFKTLKRPEKKVLVFATTYHPTMGPAEEALLALSREMPDTEFHIIASRFTRGVPSIEQFGTDMIYRVGIGSKLDKYLLPIAGVWKARKLHREHEYRFAWSIMASYGGLSGVFFSLLYPNTIFLISLDERELDRKRGISERVIGWIRKRVLRKADSVHVSEVGEEQRSKIPKGARIMERGGDARSFVNQVKQSYADLLNKQERKLHRPK